ncbi:hypothetical protein, partial [Natronincola peptidivorans]|uniref:hypothetical protein n=1 Tax=Natronincola peptidivorans TaxID=426128 RepID=UPI001AD8FB59
TIITLLNIKTPKLILLKSAQDARPLPHLSDNVPVFATFLNRTHLTLPLGGASLPVKGCGALTFP